MTVSNVLNGRAGASEKTRERVMSSARELGYVPNIAARRLKAGRAGLIGVSLPDLRSQYAMEIARGIADEVAIPELETLISVAPQDASRLELFAHGLTDGLILIAPVITPDMETVLRESQQPVVLIDPLQATTAFPHVVADDYGGMRALTDAVIDAGHRDILYLQGEADDLMRFTERRTGFRDAVALAGRTELRVTTAGSSSAYEAALDDVLAVGREHVPSAIIAASDVQAFAAIDAVRSLGLRVPADVSVVGFGDLPQASQSFPGLTTVRRPLHEMGRIAARTVLARLDGVTPVQNRT
jgi:LacI family transcriptional regulator